jgi:hypothetical protein
MKPGNTREWVEAPEVSRAGVSHPFNKQMDVAEVCLRINLVTGEKNYWDIAEKIYFTAKNRFQYFDDHYCWNYWDPLYPGDVDFEKNNTRHWVGVHQWRSGYQASEVGKIVEAYHYGIVFDETDIQRIINTNLNVMWNKDKLNPVFINSNGLGADHDTTGLASFKAAYGHSNDFKDQGQLWTGLLDFDQTIRDLYKNLRNKLAKSSWQLARDSPETRRIQGHMVENPEKYIPRHCFIFANCLLPTANLILDNMPSHAEVLWHASMLVSFDYNGRGACRGNTDTYKISKNGYLKGCDIASYDIYPVNNWDAETSGNLWYVANGIDNLFEWSDRSKPVWCWIETTKIHDRSPRKPTPAEVKSEVWMALIHGANGYGFFCHSFTKDPPPNEAAFLHDTEMISSMKAVNMQVTSLARVLNSPSTSGFASVTSSNTEIPIDIMTKNQGAENYIFAVAMRPGSTQATFSIKNGKKVEVLGENRTIKVKKGKFNDDFSDYGVHLYKIIK